MSIKTVCMLGGTGFVGYHLANQLTRAGYRILIPSRRRERHRELLVIPTVDVTNANIFDTSVLKRLFADCDAVINLVGILNERRRGDFRRVHVDLAGKVVEACRAAGVPRLIHMAALNADAKRGASQYLKTKGEAEDLVHASADESLKVTSIRPSVIFGPGDNFFNQFAAMLRRTPLMFPVVCANAKFSPVYVQDVASVFVKSLRDAHTAGGRYELCGPHTYTMEQLVTYVNRVIGTDKALLPLGDTPSRLMAKVMGMLPGSPFTTDNYLSTKQDSVCTQRCALLPTPTPLEAVVPMYVGKKFQRANYDQFRCGGRQV